MNRPWVQQIGAVLPWRRTALFCCLTVQNTGGTVRLMIQPEGEGTNLWTISEVDETIEIDSELMNCFKDTLLKNDTVTGEGFPTLKPGTFTIACAGNVQRIEVIPRWCCL